MDIIFWILWIYVLCFHHLESMTCVPDRHIKIFIFFHHVYIQYHVRHAYDEVYIVVVGVLNDRL